MSAVEENVKGEQPEFHGETYDEDRDWERLTRQIDRVHAIMEDGEWRSLRDIQDEIEEEFDVVDPQASISARLRDLRKPVNGGHTVERRYVESGLYEYRMP